MAALLAVLPSRPLLPHNGALLLLLATWAQKKWCNRPLRSTLKALTALRDQ